MDDSVVVKTVDGYRRYFVDRSDLDEILSAVNESDKADDATVWLGYKIDDNNVLHIEVYYTTPRMGSVGKRYEPLVALSPNYWQEVVVRDSDAGIDTAERVRIGRK